MSQLPALPSLDEIVKRSRRAKADAAIAVSREATPESASEQRTAPRLSIAELNDSDIDALRRRVMSGAPHDERPAWVKALDIIDLPRNALFNLAAPGIAARKSREGDRATLGMGRVSFSDVLDELGVDNRVVRGLGGFIGDVAFDPLTYIGPAGWGLKVGSGVGKGVSKVGVEVGKRGARSLTGGIKAAARGEEVGEETVRNYLKIKGYDRDGVAALAKQGMTPDQIRQQITRDIFGEGSGGALNRFTRILGSDRDFFGGSLAKAVFEPGASDALSAAGKAVGIVGVPQDEAKAAREFLTKFSRTQAPGVKFGSGGSQVAHIPFTEIGVQVPAFTNAAKRNVALYGAMTRITGLAPDAVTAGSGIEEAARAVEGLVKSLDDLDTGDPASITDDVVKALAEQTVAVREAVKSVQGPNRTPEEVFAAARLDEIAGLAQRQAQAALADMPNIAERAKLMGEIGGRVQRANREFRWLERLSKKDGFDYLPKDPNGARYVPSDPNVRFAAAEKLRSLRKALRGAKNLKNEKAVATIQQQIREAVRGAGGDGNLPFGMTREEFEATGEELLHGTNRKFGSFSTDVPNRYGRTGVDKFYFTDDTAVANNFANSGGFKQVDAAKYADADTSEEVAESLGELRKDLDKHIASGKTLAYVDVNDGQLKKVSSASEISGDDLLGGDVRLYAKDRWPTVIKAKVYGKTLDITDPKNVPADLADILRRDGIIDEAGKTLPNYSHEFSPALVKYARDRGFGKIRVRDAYESGYRSTIALPEYIGYGPVHPYDRATQEAVLGRARSGDIIDLDAADAQVAELSKQAYAGHARRLVEMSDEEAAAYSNAIDTLTQSMAAARSLADATGGSFTKHLGDDAREVLELNRMALGTNDDTIASSPLMSVRDAIKARYGDDGSMYRAVAAVEASMRKTFGTRGGVVKRAVRYLERGLSEEAANARAKSIARLSVAAKAVAEELGVEGQFKEFVEAVTALAVKLRNDADDAYYIKSYHEGLGKELSLEEAANAGVDIHDNAFRQIDRFTKDGIITPERLPKMEALAQSFIAALDDLADGDVTAGVLGERLSGYIPSAATPGARQAIRVARKNQFAPKASGNAGDKLGQLEGFQKARTTDQVRWIGADGKMRRIFQSDLALADIPKKELSERELKVLEMVREYQRLPNPPEWRRTDYAELNDLVASGRFQRLTAGANLTEGFFESNMLAMLSSRTASSQLSRSRKAFTEMFEQSGLTIDAKDYDAILASPGGKPVTLAGGAEGKVGKMVGTQPTVWINGQRWRKLSSTVIDRDNPLYRLIGDENAGRIYHEQMADAIERVAKVFSTDEDIKRWLQLYDQFQGIWKTITLSHPSWTVGDGTGNMALQMQAGMRPRAVANFGKQAVSVAWHENNLDFLRGQRLKFGGYEMSGEEFIQMLVDLNVWGADQASEVAKQLKRSDLLGIAESAQDFIEPPSSLKTIGRAVAAPVNAVKGAVAGAKSGTGIGGKALGAGREFGDEIMRSWIGPFFRVNRKVNNAQRAMLFMDLVDQGNDLETAAAKVVEGMFDYADLTHTERHTLRRLMPFYSWLRNNMVYQVSQLFTNPKFAATAPKVQSAVEEMLLGEERIPNHQRPAWMRDQLAIQFAKDPDSFVMARPLLPQTDAIQPLTLLFGTEGALDFAHYFGSGLTPVIKAATDLAYGQELFSGRKLGENADAGQVPLGEYALKQFRPARELGLVGGSSLVGAAEQGPLPLAGRLALGGKFQSQPTGDVNRRLVGQYKRKEQEYRTAISRARRNGDGDSENASIIELLKLYRRMAEVGLTDEIPQKYRPIVVGDTETATNG